MGYVIQREQVDGSFKDLAEVKPVPAPTYLDQEDLVVHYIPSFNTPKMQLGDKVRFNDEEHIVKAIEVLNPSVTKLIVTPMP